MACMTFSCFPQVNPSIQNLLVKEQLTEEQVKENLVKVRVSFFIHAYTLIWNDFQNAQRSAIIGTMSMDSLGHTVQKWSQEVNTASTLL